jgi:uncharacterized protein YkwD
MNAAGLGLAVLLIALAAGCGGGGGGSAPSAPAPLTSSGVGAPPASTPPVNVSPNTLTVVDYFTGAAIGGAVVTIDAATVPSNGGTYSTAVTSGLHALQVTASGYATFNGAIQSPGGASVRIVKLFPVTPAMTAWLAQVNADRAANGGSPVQLDDMLTIAAYDHAVDMGTQGYVAHWDPHGFAPTTRSVLLGSMLLAAENIASGFSSWVAAEQVFMAEKSNLPHQNVSDCPTDDAAAGHYCNITWPAHNWVGLAIVNLSGSPFRLYYDQEFGDLYAMYDTSVVTPEPAIGTTATLLMTGRVSGLLLGTMPAPTPISIATLNSDPTCASLCPASDETYTSAQSSVASGNAFPLNLAQNQIYEALAGPSGSTTFFAGYSAYAVFWPGGTVMPAQYATANVNVQTQDTSRQIPAAAQTMVVPNAPRPHRF